MESRSIWIYLWVGLEIYRAQPSYTKMRGGVRRATRSNRDAQGTENRTPGAVYGKPHPPVVVLCYL